MRLWPVVAGGLLLALLAQPAPQPPRQAGRGALRAAEAAALEAGGGGARARGSRPLREAGPKERERTRSLARLLHETPGPGRRLKGVSKKGLARGCFGLKLDRIGSLSGLGC
ncbi:C-type natriuretic peptide [Alligator mississippiensis]|uniref:C-type natriuretic peptide n=1 Tax=Alligator mississippiensis TaxID=8496 RepID=UPI002877603E|nr:C-type natriuretic peptide [Alligator mississippiensis]